MIIFERLQRILRHIRNEEKVADIILNLWISGKINENQANMLSDENGISGIFQYWR